MKDIVGQFLRYLKCFFQSVQEIRPVQLVGWKKPLQKRLQSLMSLQKSWKFLLCNLNGFILHNFVPFLVFVEIVQGTIKVPWTGKNHQLGHTLANLCPSGAYTKISHSVVAISARATAIDTTAILVLSTAPSAICHLLTCLPPIL